MKIRLGILETGRPPEALMSEFDSYATMAAAWLAPLNVRPEVFAVMDGVFPHSPDMADLWLVTGSKCGVYEDHAWIPPLERFIRQCHAQDVPMVGICFGHQIIAQAMGARVRKSPKGWGVGVHRYDMRPNDLLSQWDVPHLDLAVFHQDQVETCPTGATVIGGSGFCEYGVLSYGTWAVTTQAHPEFSAPFIKALLQERKGVVLNDDVADAGIGSIHDGINPDQLLPFVHALVRRDPTAA